MAYKTKAAIVADAVRDIRQAKVVEVTVYGPDDVFYVRVSKARATALVKGADGQLEVVTDEKGAVVGGYIPIDIEES